MTPETIINAADLLQTWAARHEAIVRVAEVLGQVGSLEQAVADAGKRLAAANDLVAEEEAKLESTRQSIAAAQAEAERIVNEATEQAAGAKESAAAEADKLKSYAIDAANAEIQSAKKVADEALSGVTDLAAAKAQELAEAQAEFTKVEADIDTAKVELADINARLGEARDAAKRLLAG